MYLYAYIWALSSFAMYESVHVYMLVICLVELAQQMRVKVKKIGPIREGRGERERGCVCVCMCGGDVYVYERERISEKVG